MKRRKTVNLPKDLLVEILSRVPATSLARFRSTSKEWNALITKDGSFAMKHLATAPRPSLVLMLINSRICSASVDLHGETQIDVDVKETGRFSLKDPLSNFTEEADVRDIWHCDGLLLCATEDDRLAIWNPCTGETKWIQTEKSGTKLEFYALGKSSRCNEYKVLKLEQYGGRNPRLVKMKMKIYDFTCNSWRDVGETSDWFVPPGGGRGISVNGNAYFLVSNLNVDDVLISFDFSAESFGTVTLPGDTRCYNALALSEVWVSREEQQLCVLATRSKRVFDIDIWVATKIGSGSATSWSKLISIEKVAYREQLLCFCCGMSYLVDMENIVIVCRGGHGFSKDFLNVVGEDTFIKVDHLDGKYRCSLLVNYLPSLVQIQQGT